MRKWVEHEDPDGFPECFRDDRVHIRNTTLGIFHSDSSDTPGVAAVDVDTPRLSATQLAR